MNPITLAPSGVRPLTATPYPPLITALRRSQARREAEVAIKKYDGIGYKVITWAERPRPPELDLIERHIVEAVLCYPELLADLYPRKVQATREAIAAHFGHEIPEYIYGNRLTKAYKRTLADMVEGEGIHLKAAAYHSLGRLLYALKPRLSRSEGPPLGNSPDIPRTSSDFFSHNILEKCGVTVSQPEAVIWDGRPYKVHRKGRGRPFIRLREGGKIVRRYLNESEASQQLRQPEKCGVTVSQPNPLETSGATSPEIAGEAVEPLGLSERIKRLRTASASPSQPTTPNYIDPLEL